MKMMGLPINRKRHVKRVSVVCVFLHRVDNVRIETIVCDLYFLGDQQIQNTLLDVT
jgi:hypothetical protein